jgi:hypothetical protein
MLAIKGRFFFLALGILSLVSSKPFYQAEGFHVFPLFPVERENFSLALSVCNPGSKDKVINLVFGFAIE